MIAKQDIKRLTDIVVDHSEKRGTDVAYFLSRRSGEERRLTYGDLCPGSLNLSVRRLELRHCGEQVLVGDAFGEAYIIAFQGCPLAGVIAFASYAIGNRRLAGIQAGTAGERAAAAITVRLSSCPNKRAKSEKLN